MCPFKIGYGYDVHRLVPERELWLCGIKLDHTLGLLGHSDADVAIHALCDAILGAANLRDIGYHFPDKDPKYKDADSKRLLAEVCTLIRLQGFEIGNVDITIMAEQPKINPHIPKMQNLLAQVMKINPTEVSIKATTTEKLGFTGREEGIAASAVALIYRNSLT
ncbi:MAG: 2-C-methyl-D-erythritol 2,4-cyclodiphosphate synthase [Prevotella sp.]|nr:2-C-methyl-D-erythritol 2,4-cyclodiphosphate synthase [Bacteroides sp.]MCM1366584.1 2-C-methyl-D-erythritol 2,4-cyclodiphosphate synthase [Prevotella sp.]MCM1437253.1 2-C-methyl-D-erythritol 2,4-cyclodiphosphate synthase [Prevotella sp.]